MSADLSRVRFDPLRDFSQVLLQQGRLLLDGDFNELADLIDRRLRAESFDLTSFGADPDKAGSSWVPRQTIDGFKVTATGGVLSIGKGRMYVDGLLAENHGVMPLDFDGLLAESTGSADTPYLDQPYWPTPEPVPTGGTHLAYLDVWQREVTSVEAPDLVEIAVGVDTTVRTQTAWQVRLLPNVGNISTTSDDADIPGWSEKIRPSSGRLTVDTIEVDDEDDPCGLPPTGGYRGLENQTYRVEIHEGGVPGEATFKWSRENASVVQPVVEMIDPTTLRLASVGRDDVLRISTNDWVEIIDDRVELDQQPGVIRKVTVDDTARTIAFSPALPVELRPADADEAAARHLRVRRWDQSGAVATAGGVVVTDLDIPGSSGLITVPATATTQIVLESGIVVSFSLDATDGVFRDGDHWIFAARTADTSVELLTEAPPVGIHHHYARLAIVTLPDSETDCRRLWPPLFTGGGGESCDCTVCVDPESHSSGTLTVQAALDSVKETGGSVCLHTGVYDIGPGLDIDGARSVRLHGQGIATVLVARGNAIRVNRSSGITLDHFAVVSGVSADSVISVRSCTLSSFENLLVLALGNANQRGSAIRLSGIALGLDIRDNLLAGRFGIASGLPNPDGQPVVGILGGLLRIEDNLVVGEGGIDLGGFSLYLASVAVDSNDVLAGTLGGLRATGATMAGGSVRLTANTVWSNGPAIAIGPDGIVDDNTVSSLGAVTLAADILPVGDGIVVDEVLPGRPGHVRVTGNRVHRLKGAGIVLRGPVQTWIVKQNVVDGASAGIVMDGKAEAISVSIDNNQVTEIVAAPGERAVVGISVNRTNAATVAGNSVRRVGLAFVDGLLRAGIAVAGVPQCNISGNTIDEIGPRDYAGIAAGVFATAPFDQVTVANNSIRYGPNPEPPSATWFAVVIQRPFGLQGGFGSKKAVVPLGNGTLVFTNAWAYAANFGDQHVTLNTNSTKSGGRDDGILIRVVGDAVIEGNQMEHLGFGEPVALRVQANSATVATNRARGPKSMIVLEVNEESYAAVGNITPGGVHLFGAGNGIPDPWAPLNPRVL